jgi:4'-phosphopantetheinyl transferase EntD
VLIEEILPAEVAAAEAFEDAADAVLYAEEQHAIDRAVDKRRREFATGRVCARRALARLGVPPAPIPPGARGAPQWPLGVVGSITHCAGYRAAAVARANDVATVGIDAEPHDALPAGVFGVIATAEERGELATLARDAPGVCWDRVLFSAKEAVYKAWFPLTGRWLGFKDATITLHRDGAFTARLLVAGPMLGGPAPLSAFAGRWLVRDGLLATAIAVPSPAT